MYLYHYTTADNAKRIVESGYLKQSQDGAYGRGLYQTDMDPSVLLEKIILECFNTNQKFKTRAEKLEYLEQWVDRFEVCFPFEVTQKDLNENFVTVGEKDGVIQWKYVEQDSRGNPIHLSLKGKYRCLKMITTLKL